MVGFDEGSNVGFILGQSETEKVGFIECCIVGPFVGYRRFGLDGELYVTILKDRVDEVVSVGFDDIDIEGD